MQHILQQLEAEGFFERARGGDHRAASLFARLAAYRANPSGSSSSWGWLRKGGGQNVDGYAEDAIVSNANPTDVLNVYDLVSGAGAPGARVSFNGPLPRRTSDVWEAPRALSAGELSYLKPGASVDPPPPPPPAVVCKFVPPIVPIADLSPLHAKLDTLLGAVANLALRVEQIRPVAGEDTRPELKHISQQVADVRATLSNGLAITGEGEASSRYLGTVRGKVTGVAKG